LNNAATVANAFTNNGNPVQVFVTCDAFHTTASAGTISRKATNLVFNQCRWRCWPRMMPWKKLLIWATGQIDKTLSRKLEFLLEENRVYRARLDQHSPHSHLQDDWRKVLAEKVKPFGSRLGSC
jgi:hypothetical protein